MTDVRAGLLALVVLAAACAKQPEMAPVGLSDKPGEALPDKPVSYVFDALDDRPVSSAAMRGKPTVIAFIATGDIIGQAQVDFLVAMEKNDGTKVNYALVALHPRKEIVLVEAYLSTLKVEFPVALGDPSVMAPSGPFGEIPAVPTVVILDRESKIVWKHTGLAKADELRGHLRGL
ncbi:MAG: TlpA family protein disulfide reductase [Labilithrix sp.]|nr:TlpA family protein disulfide reductase [Labilithrix sp.]